MVAEGEYVTMWVSARKRSIGRFRAPFERQCLETIVRD